MTHILDRPPWSALSGRQAEFSEGGALARRYQPDIIPFAATRDVSAASLAALAALPRAGETMAMMEAVPLAIPPGFVKVVEAPGVQMVLARTPEQVDDRRIERLSYADAE